MTFESLMFIFQDGILNIEAQAQRFDGLKSFLEARYLKNGSLKTSRIFNITSLFTPYKFTYPKNWYF